MSERIPEITEATYWAFVGRNIRDLRKQRGLALKSIAYETGYSLQAISQIERGLIDAKTSTLLAIASALGVSPSELFRDAPGYSTSLPATRYFPIRSSSTLNIITTFEKLPAAWQQLLILMTERIASELTKQDNRINNGQQPRTFLENNSFSKFTLEKAPSY